MLTIVGDNDIHGALDPRPETLTFSNGQSATLQVGGAEMISAYYQRIRAVNPDGVVLVSAGDFFQGTLIANEFQGVPVIDFLNTMKYDAVAIGNHEFDYGPVRSAPGAGTDPADLRGALLARMQQAQFPVLSCNIIDDATHQPPQWPHFACATVVTRAGVKVGLIGATTADTPHATLPNFVRGLSFLPIAEGLKRGIAEAKSLGAEVIVGVVHAGTNCSQVDDPTNNSSCSLQDELPVALRALGSPTVDALVAGHTHGHVAHFIEHVPVIESGAHGTQFGRITLYLDPKTHQVLKERTQIARPQTFCHQVIQGTEVCDSSAAARATDARLAPATYLGAPLVADPRVEGLLRDYRKAVRSEQSRSIAQLDKPIQRSPFGESPLGDLIADCMLAATRRDPRIPDADIAIQNSGGIRHDILAGAFTYGDLYEVLPFENVLVTVSLTGAQIRRIFELALLANSKVYQVAGLKITYEADQKPSTHSSDLLDPGSHEYRVSRIELSNGKPLLAEKRYTIVWNDFLAAGGDGMAPLVAALGPNVQTYHYATSIRQAVEDSLRADPRIVADKTQPFVRLKPRISFVAAH